MRITLTMTSISLALSGCIQDLLADGAALAPEASSTSTGELQVPTTSAGTGIQTVTGADEVEESSTSGAPELRPTIELFTVTPEHLSEAGAVELQLVASADVVQVRLYLDGEELAELTPADFPYAWEALSAKSNGLDRTFKVTVEDEIGLMAEAEAKLSVQLPASGAERCIFEQDKNIVSSAIEALRYTPDAIVALGSRETDAGVRIAVWKLDPDDCQALPGWPVLDQRNRDGLWVDERGMS